MDEKTSFTNTQIADLTVTDAARLTAVIMTLTVVVPVVLGAVGVSAKAAARKFKKIRINRQAKEIMKEEIE